MLITAGAIFGLIFGSFLNVVIWRVPQKLSVWFPERSYCPGCNRTLSWWENIPVLSWAALRGRCRTCQKQISARYPLVEILGGIAGVATVLKFGITPTALVMFALALTLIAISFIDLDHKIIPNVISYPGITLGLCLGILSEYTDLFRCRPFQLSCPITQGAPDSLFGMLLGGGFFWVIAEGYFFLTRRQGLGGGDVKLLAMTGAILGWQSVAPTIFAGSVIGAIFGIAMMLINKTGRQTEIPFGPWLSLGALLYMFFDLGIFRIY